MLWILVVFVAIVLIFQIVMFFVIRKKKRQWKKENVLLKYNINSKADLYRTLSRQDLDDIDRQKLEKHYEESF